MTTPLETHTRQYSHINGSASELLDRLSVQEICRGWPVYRDASEWMNFRSLFSDVAYVWTSKLFGPTLPLVRRGRRERGHRKLQESSR